MRYLFTMGILLYLSVFILAFAAVGLGAEGGDLGRIVVRSRAIDAEDAIGHCAIAKESITGRQLEQAHIGSLQEALDYVSGVDLRVRSSRGIQADLSMRGSTYEQVAVLIDGVRVGDPQTGHHNLDIPLTVADIERIDVIKEPASSLYGPGAFAGAVNIITKKSGKSSLRAESVFGEHALREQGIYCDLNAAGSFFKSSFENKSAKAARPDTDFDYHTGTVSFSRQEGSFDIDSFFGYQEKDFGAGSFYSNLFPEEEEHTRTLFTRTAVNYDLKPGVFKNNLYFRRHWDKFILRRSMPTGANYHTTYVYGLDSQLRLPFDYGELILGAEEHEERIVSNNLGRHSRFNQGLAIGLIPDLGKDWRAAVRFRDDYLQGWGWNESFNCGLGYRLIDGLWLRSSAGRAWRIPSFTELYYNDAANKGNPSLGAETSDSFSLGLEFGRGPFKMSLDRYLRRARDLIDWTRADASGPWQASNIGKADFQGLELGLSWTGAFEAGLIRVNKIQFFYNNLDTQNKQQGFSSKYALDTLKHQLVLKSSAGLCGIDFNLHLSYNQRCLGESYFVGSLSVSRRFKCKAVHFEPFVKADNFTDTEYSEIGGVIQPGRWLKSGVKFEW